ncbi:MAG: nitroreductase family protein [Bacillota bacterium]|nr:nitroreductase family protein [Bacillota bacterium]
MVIMPQIEKRRALRALSESSIPHEILVRLSEAAHMAPSCANNQPWRLVIASGPDALFRVKESLTSGNYWAKKAAAIAAFVTRPDWDAKLDHGRDYAFFDLGMAAMNFQLQAIEEGLIAHPVAGFDPAAAKAALGIPPEAVVMTLVILGYPGDASHLNEKHAALEGAARSRKPLEEVLAFDSWDARLEPKPKSGL